MSASVSRERRQTRSSTALNNSNLETGNDYSSKRKLTNKDQSESDLFRKSQRAKVLSPNENELSTTKPKFTKEKINGDQNVLKSVNNPETSSSNVSSSSSSTSTSSDSKPVSVSTRRRSANLINQLSSVSLDQVASANRKRNLSSSQDIKNENTLNENDPCSQSANASSSGLSALAQSPSSSSLNKRIKLKHKYAFKELNENTTSPTTFRLLSKDEYEQSSPYADREEASLSEITEVDEAKEDETKESLVCPVLGCKSEGHLNGISEHHYSYDTCPNYFLMSKEECTNIHQVWDKRLAEIKEKTTKFNENKKNLRNKPTCKEQTAYFHKISKDLKNIVKLPEFNKQNKQSKLNFLKNPDFVSDIKNLSTSFIINSLSNCLYTSPTPVSHYALLKHTSNESLNFFTNLNQTIAQTPDLNDLKISKYELDLFKDVLVSSTKEQIPVPSNAKKIKLANKSDKIIQFGNYEIETWYKSPYPDDFWQLNKIFICQYCLTFMKSHSVLNRHLEKCLWRHPPGREIYRKDNLSFFEVDGKMNKIYCQNLCLLAKLFIDHKTLYYEVEPFLFYVLTRYNEEMGSFQMVGYFSKEKQSVLNYNLSCILILPQYMNQGYGRVLIDFSYLLSRVEGKVGSPERPLSDLGLISYRSYWKSKLLLYLSKHLDDSEISVKEITAETAILTNDLISTLQYIGLIKYWKGKHVILKDVEYIQRYVEKKNLYSRDVDVGCLKWSPYVYQPIISDAVGSGKNLVKNNKTCLPTN